MNDKTEGIEQYLSTYQRTETKQLVEVTEDNLMELARLLGGTITFTVHGLPQVTIPHSWTFEVGDLITFTGQAQRSGWVPAETGELINGGDLR